MNTNCTIVIPAQAGIQIKSRVRGGMSSILFRAAARKGLDSRLRGNDDFKASESPR